MATRNQRSNMKKYGEGSSKYIIDKPMKSGISTKLHLSANT